MAKKISGHKKYIAAAPKQFRELLTELRAQISKVLPDAEEIIKYNMPGFAIGDQIIAGYAAFSKQCGLYVNAGAIAEHSKDLKALKLKPTKTGITFTEKNPIPAKLVKKLVLSSRKMNGV